MKLSRKFKEKLGFTLAEVMIVVAILAILTAVAAPNVAKYARSIRLRELNDSARAIYMAAEHKFTADVNKGVKLSESLELISGDGLEPIADKRYKFEPSTNPDVKIPTMMGYVINRSGDNNKLVNIVESELEDNNYIVEFNPETGDVYGVFYSNETDFTEEDYENNYNTPGSNFDNAVHDGLKNDKLIGFYGNETIKPDEIEKREISKPSVKVINKEKLVVEITNNGDKDEHLEVKVDGMGDIVPRSSNAYIPAGKYVIIILDSLDGNTDFTLSGPLPDATVIYEKPMTLTDCEDVNLTVTFYDEEGKSRDQTVTKTFNPLFADGSSNSTVYVDYGRHLQNLEKANPTDVIIRRTIDFDNGAGSYEGWQGTYPDRKFNAIYNKLSFNISAPSGAEIRNMEAAGGGLFNMLGANSTVKNLTFRNCSAEESFDKQAGVLCAAISSVTGSNITISNVAVINPLVHGDTSGALIGRIDGMDSNDAVIENCKIYVEANTDENWSDPTSDPYSKYVIDGKSEAGGLVGNMQNVTIKNSYSSVKVKSNGTAGGLVGTAGNGSIIENSFAGGHTYYGIYKGNSKDSKTVSLEDNVSGATAGGIVGNNNEGNYTLKGTVFSSCSVSGTNVDPAYNGTAAFDPNTDTVYTLGTAYKTDGATVTEIKKSADTKVKTAEDVLIKDEADFTVGKRYDMKVSSVFKYPVPGGMIMHGDWCNTEDITGFIYWENEGTDYRIQALWYGKGKPDELTIPADKQLCKEQDGNNINAYGYAAFTIGGSLDNLVEFKDAGGNDIDDAIKPLEETSAASIVDGIRKILKESDDLKDKISNVEDVKINIYSGIDVGKGLVTATVSGHDYTFAPDFYAIYAEDSTDPAKKAGTDPDTYGVRCKNHLQNVANALSGNFVQSHDINLKDDTTGLTPIGNSADKFTGTYNGGSYRIINAKINSTDTTENAGLFGVTDGAQLENIVMFVEAAAAENFVEIKGKNVGVIVGNAENAENAGKITNCVAAGYTVIGSENSGGIAGISACPITNCEANIKFDNVTNAVGGIAGSSTGDVTNCYALVHDYVGHAAQVGGIVGGAVSGKVDNCYSMFKGMFKSGFPIANHTEGKNIYVVDSGFYPKKATIPNVNDTEVEFEDLALKLDGSKNAVKTYISDAKIYIPNGQVNSYPYLAKVTDKDGNAVHYGPVPIPGTKGQLVTGPIAGVFNLREYNYSNNGHSGQFDGLLSYDKHNQVFYAEKQVDNPVQNGEEPLNYIGVFLEQSCDIYDGTIKIIVNGETVENAKIKKFEEAFQSEYGMNVASQFIQKSGDYNFVNSEGNFDAYTHNGETYQTDLLKRFNFYLILDDAGKIRWFKETDVIEIWYINDATDTDGILVRAKGTSLSPTYNSRFFSELPDANYDMSKFPRVGTFSITTPNKSMPNEKYLYAGVQGQVYGEEGNDKANGILGILIEESRIEDIPEGRINVTLDKVFYELEPLDDILKERGITIVNDYKVNIRGYKAYAFANLRSDALWNSRDVVVYYGTNPFAYFDQSYRMTGQATANTAGNEYTEQEEAELAENKKKIGLAITYEDDSGKKTTKVKFSDETVIGTVTGYNNAKVSILISNDLDWTKLKAYVVNNVNYPDKKVSTNINPESLVPENSSDFDEFKSKYGDYKFYSIEGDINVDTFKLAIAYDGREILETSKF